MNNYCFTLLNLFYFTWYIEMTIIEQVMPINFWFSPLTSYTAFLPYITWVALGEDSVDFTLTLKSVRKN